MSHREKESLPDIPAGVVAYDRRWPQMEYGDWFDHLDEVYQEWLPRFERLKAAFTDEVLCRASKRDTADLHAGHGEAIFNAAFGWVLGKGMNPVNAWYFAKYCVEGDMRKVRSIG